MGLVRTFCIHVQILKGQVNTFKGSQPQKEKNVLLTDILKKQVKRFILLIFKFIESGMTELLIIYSKQASKSF